MKTRRMLCMAAIVGMGIGTGMGASAQQTGGGDRPAVVTIMQVAEMMKYPILPYRLDALAGHLARMIVHDRPALRRRMKQLALLYFEYETARRLELSLMATRRNLEAIYELHRQQQRRSEVDDVSVLRAHNALLGAERTLVNQVQARRRLLLDILDVTHLIEAQEAEHGGATASSEYLDQQ